MNDTHVDDINLMRDYIRIIEKRTMPYWMYQFCHMTVMLGLLGDSYKYDFPKNNCW